MRIFQLLFIFLCYSSIFAQKQNFRSRSEIGFLLGGSYYIGDLNQFGHFKNTQLSGGVLYRFNINSRVSLRANATFGSVEASDAASRNKIVQNRNLSFSSQLYEVGAGLEFSYFPFQLGHPRYKGTAYLLTEIAFFHMNPIAEINGDQIELQSLGTEGQGTSLSSKGNYSKTQLAIPLGVGCKFSLGKSISLSFEYGIRKTFTDYLDDVGGSRYVNRDELAEINGPLAAALSNRSLDGSIYGRRGNPATKDWYVFFGGMITFKLGQPNKCVAP